MTVTPQQVTTTQHSSNTSRKLTSRPYDDLWAPWLCDRATHRLSWLRTGQDVGPKCMPGRTQLRGHPSSHGRSDLSTARPLRFKEVHR